MAQQQLHNDGYDADIELLAKDVNHRSVPGLGIDHGATAVDQPEQNRDTVNDTDSQAYAAWQRSEVARRWQYVPRPLPEEPSNDHDGSEPYRHRQERRDSHIQRQSQASYEKPGHYAYTHGRVQVFDRRASAGSSMTGRAQEAYSHKKQRQQDDERRRIRQEYDSTSYDPRGSSRSSNYYDSQISSPAISMHDGRYPSMHTTRGRQLTQHAAQRPQQRQPSSSSDSYTSDE